ncbi:MAG TPA: glycosyl hydrolase, partial [Roseomonas sp.]|nr:glycosyl hydrolase [Roseomonas sp.]
MTALGVYVGNDASHLNQFEDWLGRDVDLVHAVVGSANWTDYTSSVSWMINSLWSGTNDSLFWSVPLIVADGSASLGAAASGSYNSYYRSVAQTIANNTDGSGPIYIRTGWEFNGDWFAWSAQGQAGNFAEAFRQFVDSFRSVSDRFKFEWNVDAASGGMNPADAYPGDKYVDVVGMDFYWKPEYSGTDPVKAFQDMANREYGLQWLENFAAAHGKPTGYSEWGVTGDNAAAYIKLVQEWFGNHNVVYQSYWDSNSAYPGEMSDGTDPNSGAAYKAAFSGPSHTATVVIDQPAASAPTSTSTAPSTTPAPSSGAPAESAGWAKQFWGSSAKETISGSAGHDQINGGGGDTLKGGLGDDTYIVTTGDVVVEAAGQGIDTVMTWLNNYVLPAN